MSSGAGKIGQIVVDVRSGINLNSPQEAKKKNIRAYANMAIRYRKDLPVEEGLVLLLI
jgi:hypothetical protein